MTRFAYAVAASLALAAPVAANSLTVLLPSLTFPSETISTSAKNCAPVPTQATCQLAE